MTSDTERPAGHTTGASPLPPDRAFVIQLRTTADGDELFVGRAEHIASGRAARFASMTELVAFVRHVLAAQDTSAD